MADAIVIKIGLDASDIGNAQGKIRASVKSALDSALPDAKEVGKKIGNALADGMAEGIAKARQLRTQLDQILSPVARQRTNESAETKHQQKLNEIRERGAQQQASIAAKAAAQEATIRAKAAADAERDARRFAEAQARIAGRGAPPDSAIAFFKRYSSTIREAGESIQQAGYGLLGLTAGILNVGKSAVTSAVNIDRQVNVLKALTGSAAEAEKRFASLTKLASQTPGLTTSLAATLDAQLRVANVSGNTIDKLLPAIGRLNAVSPLGDPQKFAQNLVQLITQGFERADLKELVGQSPLAGEIIKSIFNVDSPTNGKAIKEAAQKLGITTTDAFFSAFAQAAQNNPKLAGITESLGTQFEKLQDRILVALRPLGLSIVEALKPLVDSVVPIIERLSAAFSALPQGAQQAIIVLGGLTAVVGPLVIALGGLIQTFGALGNIFTVISSLFATGGGAAASGGILAGLATTLGGIAAAVPPVALALGGLAIVIGAVVAAYQLFGSTAEQVSIQTKNDLVASQERVKVGQQEVDSLRNLQEQTSLNAAEQSKIKSLYDALDPVQKARVGVYAEESGGVETLTGKLNGLVQVLDETNQKRLEAQRIAASDAGAGIVNDLQINGLRDYSDKIDSLNKQVEDYTRKQIEAEKTGERFGRSLAGPGTSAAEVYAQKIREISGELDKTKSAAANNQKQYIALGAAFREAAKASGKTTEEFIKQSIAASGLGGDLVGLERRIRQLAGLGASASAPSRAALLARGAVIPEVDTTKTKTPPGGRTSTKSVEETLLARLTKQSEEADLAIKQLQDTTSTEFGLRIKIEDKQAFKSELEEIIKLRRELGLPLTSPLPKDEAEAKRTIENLKSAVKNLEDFKKLGEFTKDLDPLATFKNFNANNLIEQTKKFNELQTELAQKSDGVKQATEEEAIAKQLLTDKYIGLAEEQKKSLLLKAREIDQADAARKADEDRRKDLARDFRSAERVLRSKELEVQNAINAGVITEAQGRTAVLAIQRESAQQQIAILQNQAALEVDPEKIAQFREQIEALKGLGAELTPLQGFFKGFRSEAETLAESFERIGKSFKDSVLGVVDSGIDKLTQKLGFFKSLVGDILKSLTRVLLGGLLQPRGGVAAAGGGGIGGILGSILGGGSGGGLGGFATGGFAGGGGAASILGGGSSGGGGGILGTLINAVGGGGISAPRSLSLGGLPIAGSIPFPTSAIPGAPGGGVGGGLSSLFGGLGGGLSGLFKGIGFGQKAGSGGALAGALPLLGLSLGSSLGTDRLTSILGGAAGGLLGIGLSAAPSIFAAGGIAASGGALSGLGFLGTLFSNPFTAIAAGLALPAIFLLGRARQRKRDEKTSGDALQDAVDQIKDIRKQVESNELTLNVSDARKLFDSQILQPFIAQISQLKSKSVRESRLKNQTVDLRNLFEKEVIPAVQAQKAKQGINDKLIPEFAFGGIVPGRPTPGIDSVLARLSPGEMVLTTNHQAMLQSIAGRNVFQAIGVPNSGEAVGDGSTAFASGGFVGAASRQVTTPTINMTVQLVVSGDEAVEILNAAASTDSGQQILVNARKSAQRNRLTR